jgi:hypothetical protein
MPHRPPQNFASTVIEAQLIARSSDQELTTLLDRLDLFFVNAFALDLAVNAFANWYRPFVSNPWNFFDALVVAISLSLAMAPDQSHSLATSLQAVRVLRVVGRISPLRNIVAALATAMLPVLGVLSILVLLIGIGPDPAPARHPLPFNSPSAQRLPPFLALRSISSLPRPSLPPFQA